MALKPLDILKLTPKSNCKQCGNATCMAFAAKVSQGAITLDKCPHLSAEALATLGEAAAPPMKSVKVGAGKSEYTLGGETVLFRHDKTFVSRTRYAVCVCQNSVDRKLPEIARVDYERIGERMYVEFINVEYTGDKAGFIDTVKKALAADRTLILSVSDVDAASAALDLAKDTKPILNGANPSNYQAMNELAVKAGVTLGVTGENLDTIYDTVTALEALGNKNLVIDVGFSSIKEAFANAVQLRRAAIKDGDHSAGYPAIVNVARLAHGKHEMQLALASVFTLKYGSIIIMEGMTYAQALPLYGLRQNIFTDPQKPMKVSPGIYPLNGADENALCATTVDFALTYFIVRGELERSGMPMNLLVSDAGGYSVLTAWAAGKLSASTIAKFMKEYDIEGKIKNRVLIIPGKVAVLKGELEEALPGWKIVVAPREAVEIVKFLKEFVAQGGTGKVSDTTPGAKVSDTASGAKVSDTTPGAKVSDTTPGAKVSDTTPGAKVSDTTSSAKVSDTTPGAKVSDTAADAKVSGTTPGAKVSDTMPGAKVSDTAPGAKVSDTAPGTKVSDTTPTSKRLAIRREYGFTTIGERIHCISPAIRAAMDEKDPAPILKRAKEQLDAGAVYLDVNIGPAEKNGEELMKWAVTLLQENFDNVPLCLDTANKRAIEAGISVYNRANGKPIVNSADAGDRISNIDLAAANDAICIALCSKAGVPSDNDERMTYCQEMLERGMKQGMDAKDLWFDPLFLVIKGMQDKQAEVLAFIKQLADMGFNSTGGLSNVSNMMPKHIRPIMDSVMVAMAINNGLTSAIVNPCDLRLMESIKSAAIIMNRSLYADSYLEL